MILMFLKAANIPRELGHAHFFRGGGGGQSMEITGKKEG
jgi:hypothetical protein